jgi:hypothetical protein
VGSSGHNGEHWGIKSGKVHLALQNNNFHLIIHMNTGPSGRAV